MNENKINMVSSKREKGERERGREREKDIYYFSSLLFSIRMSGGILLLEVHSHQKSFPILHLIGSLIVPGLKCSVSLL